ncbi:NIF-domain-containing protein [Guyanagaster necrorhizus]|uniref:NIF-domain-containing protein n=1 Tax=Guyanagaster necrorhizus TaxID=856835 RepID=A0A9P8AVA0_9AGAR|nr:NIF-domain-containing protein [Guyanagaster necrorhizus MCA 3950]KAG7449313.1 NIF-domain-containing protein [Guyanagaster necrorhizus MCA 3950]
MNSLAYLSRQFDVLASVRTPPSTPTSEHQSLHPDRRCHSSATESPLPHVKPWSTKSFLFSPQPNPAPAPTKRSYPSRFISFPNRAARPHPDSSATVSIEMQVVPKQTFHTLFNRTFFVRVLLLAWDALQTVWTSWIESRALHGQPMMSIQVVAASPEKDSTDEDTDDTSPRLDLLPAKPAPPLLQSSLFPSVNHSYIHSTLLLDAKSSSSPTSTPQPPEIPSATHSRSSTPSLTTRKTPFHLPKTLVLDLDETLIHSTSRPMPSSSSGSGFFGLSTFTRRNKSSGHVVEVVMGGRSTLYHVYKRPFVDFFLRTVSGWYTLVIFTASMQEYADPVIDWLDAGRGILSNRLFRDSCTQLPNGSYTKDLSVVEGDLARVCLVDNSPISYRVNEANGIPIEGWTHDPSDEALLDLLPVLDSLRFTSDVRRVLGLRCVGGSS